jgi:FkbM family methyltransferase
MRALLRTARFFADHPLTRDDQLQAWRRFITWQIRSRLKGEAIVPWIGGQRLAVRSGMWGATANIYVGLQEFAGMMLPLHFLRAGDLFLDAGANVGTYTILASGVSGARTWAFEPAPETLPDLKRNIAINGLEGLASVFELALSDNDGEAHFSVGRGPKNQITSGVGANVRTVPLRRLDSLIGDEQPIMIKLDVEEHETEVLNGANATLANPTLRVIMSESASPEIFDLLTAHSFAIAYYDPFSRQLSEKDVGYPSNAIFVRDRDFVVDRLSAAKPVTIFGQAI